MYCSSPILKQSLATAPSFLRAYFDANLTSSLEDFEREAPRYSVFLVQRAAEMQQEITPSNSTTQQ
jgi:hypothetical protein